MSIMLNIAHAYTDEVFYKIKPGKLHKGGTVNVSILDEKDSFKVKMRYEISKKTWLPVPTHYLKGETVQELPLSFKDERGYLELEALGTISTPKAVITFLKRTDFGELKNAYEILVRPINGKFRTKIIYHPEIPSLGWGKVDISFIDSNPLFNGYEVVAEINPQDEYTGQDI